MDGLNLSTTSNDQLTAAVDSILDYRSKTCGKNLSDLARRLRKVLGFKCTGICQIADPFHNKASIIACDAEPSIDSSGEIDLDESPCRFVNKTTEFFVEDRVRDYFPTAKILTSVNGRAYGGVRCESSVDGIIGTVFYVHDCPVVEDRQVSRVLRLFADEASRFLLTDREKKSHKTLQKCAHEAAFHRKECREILSEVVAEIAHEVNQPMFTIGNYAKACLNSLDRKEVTAMADIREWLNRISKTSDQPSSTIQRLRNLKREVTDERKEADTRATILAAIERIRWQVQRSLAIVTTRFDPVLPQMQVDAIRFQQSLISLIQNACEAIDSSDCKLRTIEVSAYSDNGHLVVSVDDTGIGRPADLGDSIIERFVTTKPGRMGLGLSRCRSYVEEHGGTIRFMLKESAGVRVEMLFPIKEYYL